MHGDLFVIPGFVLYLIVVVVVVVCHSEKELSTPSALEDKVNTLCSHSPHKPKKHCLSGWASVFFSEP